jgi:hypothetical protein
MQQNVLHIKLIVKEVNDLLYKEESLTYCMQNEFSFTLMVRAFKRYCVCWLC